MSATTPRAWVVSITPFTPQGTLDEPAFRRHLLRLSEAGQGVYVGSSNVGEGFTLSEAEHARLLALAIETLAGKVPVRHGGVEARSIAEAQHMLRVAGHAGAEAVHLFQPDRGHASSKPGLDELKAFFVEVLEASDSPVVLSNYPSLGYPLPLELLAELVDRFPQIIAFRDSGGDPAYLNRLRRDFADRLEIYCAGARNLPVALLHGFGAMTIEANIAPGMVAKLFAPDQSAAALRQNFARFMHVNLALTGGAAPARGIKSMLSHFQLCHNVLRPPLAPLTQGEKLFAEFAREAMAELEEARI